MALLIPNLLIFPLQRLIDEYWLTSKLFLRFWAESQVSISLEIFQIWFKIIESRKLGKPSWWFDCFKWNLQITALASKHAKNKIQIIQKTYNISFFPPWRWEIHPELTVADFNWLRHHVYPECQMRAIFEVPFRIGTNEKILHFILSQCNVEDEITHYMFLFWAFQYRSISSFLLRLIYPYPYFSFFEIQTDPCLYLKFHSNKQKKRFFRRVRQLHFEHLVGHLEHLVHLVQAQQTDGKFFSPRVSKSLLG